MLASLRGSVDPPLPADQEQELREARLKAAHGSPRWEELQEVDLVERMGGRVVVSAESDDVYQRYRGHVWATASASPVSDLTPLYYVVGEDNSLVFYEKLAGAWSERVAQQAERERRRAARRPRPTWAQR
jgi:hypothetical protein